MDQLVGSGQAENQATDNIGFDLRPKLISREQYLRWFITRRERRPRDQSNTMDTPEYSLPSLGPKESFQVFDQTGFDLSNPLARYTELGGDVLECPGSREDEGPRR